MAQHLAEQGLDVCVVAARPPGENFTPPPSPGFEVRYVDWRDARRTAAPVDRVLRGRSELWRAARSVWKNAFEIPDEARPWIRPAADVATELARRNRPDVILASGSPWSCFLVASEVAAACGSPWVAEYRDPWTDSPFFRKDTWRIRAPVDRRLERRTLSTASGVVAVTPQWTEHFQHKHASIPVACVENGFVPSEFPAERQPAKALTIAFTGMFYQKFQDMGMLLEGMCELPENIRDQIEFQICSRDAKPFEKFMSDVARFRLGGSVRFLGALARDAAIRLQRNADVLCFPCFVGEDTGKFFSSKIYDYLGARRPILCLSAQGSDSPVERLVESHRAGVVARSAEDVAAALMRWWRQKADAGVPDTPAADLEPLTRAAQGRRMLAFLNEVSRRAA